MKLCVQIVAFLVLSMRVLFGNNGDDTVIYKTNYRPLKILMVVEKFPHIGQVYIINQITGLLDRGHDVRILAQIKPDCLGKMQTEIQEYDLLSRVYYEDCPESYDSFDWILCQFGELGDAFALLKKEGKFKTKLATCFRGGDLSSEKNLKEGRYKALFEFGDLFLPVSHFFKERLIRLGCDAKKIVVQHSAIDCKKFKFRKREFPCDGHIRIISVGRLYEKKGLEYAIRAVAQVAKKGHAITYTIIGAGSSQAKLQALIKELKAESYITLQTDPLTSAEVAMRLDASHIFVLPSVTARSGTQEGIANALKEAMAMGLQVVATHHDGTSELIDDGKSGHLVPERDADALAKKLCDVIAHPENWELQASLGRVKVEDEFEMERENDRLEAFLFL